MASQGYSSKSACDNVIASVQKNCSDDKCFERNTAKDGSFYFNLKSTNGQVIGKSEMYNGFASVAKNAPGTSVEKES